MRTPLIAGNWKLNKTISEACELASQLVAGLSEVNGRDIVIAPIFTALANVSDVIKESPIQLAAQNCYPVDSGAFTGEISPQFLCDAGCQFVIVGHSERRQLLGETDQFIHQKITKSLEVNLKPILCVGETLEQRECGQMFDVLRQQINGALEDLTAVQMETIVVAYEPVWAIGTGKTASNDQAQEAHAFIRQCLEKLFNPSVAEKVRILYGGSVKPNNIDGLMAEDDIDGALVGGASLNADDFIRIIQFNS